MSPAMIHAPLFPIYMSSSPSGFLSLAGSGAWLFMIVTHPLGGNLSFSLVTLSSKRGVIGRGPWSSTWMLSFSKTMSPPFAYVVAWS